MENKPIKNTKDYKHVLKEIEGLMRGKRNTPQGDRLDVLVTLVEAWEAKHYALRGDAVRIISARGAEPHEKRKYRDE